MPEKTRRVLLQSIPAALLSARAIRPLSVGVVTEPGGTHLDLLLKGVAKYDGVAKVGMADPSGQSFERARTYLGRYGLALRAFPDYAQMLGETRPDLTIVTVEAQHNPGVVEAALSADSHVLSEKPPCVRAAQ